jgi:hypothetical protein
MLVHLTLADNRLVTEERLLRISSAASAMSASMPTASPIFSPTAVRERFTGSGCRITSPRGRQEPDVEIAARNVSWEGR